MSAISKLAIDLRDTSTQIARMEREIAAHPEQSGLVFSLKSLQKRLRILEERFAELSKESLLDVVDYRIVPAREGRYPIAAVGQSLTSFQEMVTVFFDAVKTGPKIRSRISADIAELSTMDFGYAYSGSLGFALTIPNERMLLIESDLDRAVERTFQVIHALETKDLAALANEVGVASIRRAYSWAKVHAKHGMSVEIKFKRGVEIKNRTIIEAQQLTRLTELIEQTSDVTREPVTLTGILVGIDETDWDFHFKPETGEEIRGKLAEAFTFERPISIPSAALTVRLVKKTVVHYAIDKEDISWELEGIVYN